MKRILIFYASYGRGHLSAANAIKQHIDRNFCGFKTDLVDCILYINKPINTLTTRTYINLTKNFPWAWGEVYNQSQKKPILKITSYTNKLLSLKLLKLLKQTTPDIIISTHPFGTQMVSYLKEKSLTKCKLATIITDFAPHEQWLVGKDFIDYFFVAHEKMKKDLINYNIPENKVFATGIPLSYKFLMHYNKDDIINSFNLNPNKKIILFLCGGEFGINSDRVLNIFKSFIRNANNYQIIAISGKSTKLYNTFKSIVNNLNANSFVTVIPYTNQIAELMSISDLIVTKPGRTYFY